MKKKTVIIIASVAIILMVVLVYFFGIEKKEKPYVTDNWSETYSPNDKIPYGTYVMKELLDTFGLFSQFIEIDSKVEKALVDVENQNDIYFFIGKKNYISDDAVERLADFVFEGNTAFIAAEKMPVYLNRLFFLNPNKLYKTKRDSIQYFSFNNKKIKQNNYTFKYINNNKNKMYNWKFFESKNYDLWGSNKAYELGKNQNNETNFVKITYGDGAFYFHSNPYVFTNICMLKKDGFNYAESVLKHIPPGQVQWDKYNLNYHYSSKSNNNNSNNDGDGDEPRRSILEFIFKNKALTWAFIILVITVILYVVFKGKRKQDIVKPVDPKENTSLKYIETLSSLYLQEKQHGKLVKLKEQTFMNFIAEHYYLTSVNINSEFIDKLAEKAQVKKSKIEDLFSMFSALNGQYNVTDDELIELHILIEYFYKNCK